MSRFRNVLIVDDEPGTLRVLGAVLEDAGYRVTTASNGRAALDHLEAEPHDIVLLDFLMPILDGADTLRAIRKSAALADIPVVMISGVTESIVRRRCRGAYDVFLRKPFALDDLLETIEGVAKKRARTKKRG